MPYRSWIRFFVMVCLLEFGFLHQHWSWNTVLITDLYIETWYSCYMSILWNSVFLAVMLWFAVAYDLAPCLELFGRRNKAIRCWGYCISILLKKKSSNLLLRFYLFVDYWVVDPQLFIYIFTIDERLSLTILYVQVHTRHCLLFWAVIVWILDFIDLCKCLIVHQKS